MAGGVPATWYMDNGAPPGLLDEPQPEPLPTSLISGPPGAPSPSVPSPDQMAVKAMMPVMAPPLVSDGLAAQGQKIGQVGRQAVADARVAKQELGDAAIAGVKANDKLVDVERQKAAAEAHGFDQQVQVVADYQKRLDKVRQDEAAAVASAKSKYAEAVDDAKYAGITGDQRRELQRVLNDPAATVQQKATAKSRLDKAQNVDPDQYLGSAGRKITAAIATALGAYGSALTGGPNHALQIIQQAIQDNIDAQKTNFAKKEREASRAKDGIADTKAEFVDEQHKAMQDYGIGLAMAEKKLSKIMAGLKDPEAVARGEQVMAGIQTEKIKNELALDQYVSSQYLNALVAQGGLMTNKAQLDHDKAKMAASGKGPPAIEGYRFTGKTQPTAPALDRAEKAQTLVRAGTDLIDEAIRLRDEYGSEHLGGKVQSRMDVLQNALITKIGQMSEAGVIQPGEAERFKEAVGEISGVGFVKDRLKAVKWLMRKEADAAARAAGFEPVGREREPSEKGAEE